MTKSIEKGAGEHSPSYLAHTEHTRGKDRVRNTFSNVGKFALVGAFVVGPTLFAPANAQDTAPAAETSESVTFQVLPGMPYEDYTDCGRGETSDLYVADATNPQLLFGPGSTNRALIPCDLPTDPKSAEAMNSILNAPGGLAFKTKQYTTGRWEASADDPEYEIKYHNVNSHCSDAFIDKTPFSTIRVPEEAQPAPGTDKEIAIIDKTNPDEVKAFEAWVASVDHDNKIVYGCFGAGMLNPQETIGVFDEGSSTAASGLPYLGYHITESEMKNERADKQIGVIILAPSKGTVGTSSRHPGDGWETSAVPLSFPEGTVLTLPDGTPPLPEDASPAAKTIWQGIMDYGAVVVDKGGCKMCIRTELLDSFDDPSVYETWKGGKSPEEIMGELPLDQLVALEPDYITLGERVSSWVDSQKYTKKTADGLLEIDASKSTYVTVDQSSDPVKLLDDLGAPAISTN
jgi:hypothetical protein